YAPDTLLDLESGQVTLREALSRQFEIGRLTRPVLERYAERTGAAELRRVLADENRLREWLAGGDLLDLVSAFPPDGLDPEEFVRVLRPLAPRLYSIASSQRATPAEAHLTVAVVEYEHHGRLRRG